MTRRFTLFVALLLAAMLPSLAVAATLKVGPKAAYQTLTAAIEALPADGGTIELAPGEYREKVTIAKPNVRLIGKARGRTTWSSSGATGRSRPAARPSRSR